MPQIARVTVFTGSSPGADPSYVRAAREVAVAIARAGMGLVYGGGNVGLMGAVATAGRDSGAEVIGVIPKALVDKEIAHHDLSRLEIVDDMHERKQRMNDLCDAFVMLPGGAGSLEEFFEVWTWQQLGLHAKPIAVYDVNGFWDPLLDMIDRLVDEEFISAHFRDSLIVTDDPEELLEAMRSWRPPMPKWGESVADAEL